MLSTECILDLARPSITANLWRGLYLLVKVSRIGQFLLVDSRKQIFFYAIQQGIVHLHAMLVKCELDGPTPILSMSKLKYILP
jgi:hypothetical protein